MVNRRFPQESEHSSEPENSSSGPHGPPRDGKPFAGAGEHGPRSFQRIYVKRVGPFGLLPFFLVTGLFAAVMLVFFLGAFLLLLPVAGIVFAAALFAGLLRGRTRWPR